MACLPYVCNMCAFSCEGKKRGGEHLRHANRAVESCVFVSVLKPL